MAMMEDNAPSQRRRIAELIVLIGLVVGFLVVSFVRQPIFSALDRDVVGIIIAAGLTLIMYSFLYRDNPLFKAAENLYVGVALGYGAIITWREVLRPQVYEPLFRAATSDAFWNAMLHKSVPIFLGLLLLTRLSKTRSWPSRYSYGLLVGWGAGMAIYATVHSVILKQTHAAIAPLWVTIEGGAPGLFTGAWFNQVALPMLGTLVILVGTISVLFYFFFSIQHKRIGAAVSSTGIWFLMISFGAVFGSTVMGRVSLLIGRVQFLLVDWLRLSLPSG